MSEKRKVQISLKSFLKPKRRGIAAGNEGQGTVETVTIDEELGQAQGAISEGRDPGASEIAPLAIAEGPNESELDDHPGTSTSTAPTSRNKGRRFRQQWAKDFSWIRYDAATDKVFCEVCIAATTKAFIDPKKQRGMAQKSLKVFTQAGWADYDHGKAGLARHAKSAIHMDAVTSLAIESNFECGYSSRILDETTMRTLKANREALDGIWDAVIFLGEQGLAIRGHTDEQSNLTKVLQLVSRHNIGLKNWLERKVQKLHTWTSHDIQETILRQLANATLRNILLDITKAKYYSIIVDETSDITNVEQMSLCLRYTDENLEAHELFLGLHQCDRTTAESLKRYIENCLLSLGLNFDNCRGQAYDGASVMSGRFNGVQQRFKDESPNMVYMYCAGHELNLVVKECLNFLPEGITALSGLDSVAKLLRKSPKKKAAFHNFLDVNNEDQHMRATVRPLCPTRWTMDKPAIDSFLENYEAILDFLSEISKDEEFASKQRSLASSFLRAMEEFNVYFMLRIFQKVLEITTPAHIQAQKRGISVEQFRGIFQHLVGSISDHSNDAHGRTAFIQFCKEEGRRLTDGLTEPSKPRNTPRSTRHHYVGARTSLTESDHQETPTITAHLERVFKALFEHTAQELLRRYSVRDIDAVVHLETVLISIGGFSKYSESEVASSLNFLKGFYPSDIGNEIDGELTTIRLKLSTDNYSVSSVEDFRKFLIENKPAIFFVKNLVVLLNIYLALPCSTCECERSFSALRRVKSYLRSTTSQRRLNHLMVLHIHRADGLRISDQEAKKTGMISLPTVIDAWIDENQQRRNIFAKSH